MLESVCSGMSLLISWKSGKEKRGEGRVQNVPLRAQQWPNLVLPDLSSGTFHPSPPGPQAGNQTFNLQASGATPDPTKVRGFPGILVKNSNISKIIPHSRGSAK